MQPEKLICAGCLAISAGAIAVGTHQPVASVQNNAGDVRVEYAMPYSGWGKLLSLGCVVGSGFFLSLGLKQNLPTLPSSKKQPKALIENSESVLLQTSIESEEILEPLKTKDESPLKQTGQSFFELLRSHKKKHTFFPAETGAGKTTALLGAMDYIHTKSPGAIFLGSTAKPTAWGGLEDMKWEDGKSCVINISKTEPYSVVKLRDRLSRANQAMERRQRERQKCEQQGMPCEFPPIYLIIDEWLRTLAIAKVYDSEQNQGKKAGDDFSRIREEIIQLVEDFLYAGREDNVIVWLFGQDHQAQNAHINTGLWKNFGFVILATKGYVGSIRDALFGRSPIISGNQIKQQVWGEVEEFERTATGSFCYSNLVGHQVLSLPYLPDIKRKKIFKANNNVVEFKQKLDDELLTGDLW